MFITGKMSEETYTQLRAEWQENIRNTEARLVEAERNTHAIMVDLDLALALLSKAHLLYERLDEKSQARLLKILAKRIIINPDGQIIDHELHSPFTYLWSIAQGLEDPSSSHRDSEQVRLGALEEAVSDPLSAFCLNKAPDPLYASEQFLDLVRFEQRSKLDELPDDWKKVGREVFLI